MERVVTINLNGNPYQLEEPAYDALREYIRGAEDALASNPDKTEVIRDLEQAVADKCTRYLSHTKSVVSAEEMRQILEEMGPVEGDAQSGREESGARAESDEPRAQRRLYRVYDRISWTGVSAGMAAYAGVDATWVRVAWVLSALLTGGFSVLIYLVLIFVMPVASTAEELAAAHGAPFNAQEIVERAKREYDRAAENATRTWRRERRAWRRQARHYSGIWGDAFIYDGPPAPPGKPVGYVTRMFAGLFAFVFSIVTAALLIAFLLALFSLLGQGSVLGWTPPPDVPTWLAIVVLCIAYAAISSPFSAMRRSSYATLHGYRGAGSGADGFVMLALIALGMWFAWMYWPEARLAMEQSYIVVRDFLVSLD